MNTHIISTCSPEIGSAHVTEYKENSRNFKNSTDHKETKRAWQLIFIISGGGGSFRDTKFFWTWTFRPQRSSINKYH